jgi:hypothetical protein
MNKYILLVFAFFFIISAKSQNINKIEYFIDADPGYGGGTDVPITVITPVTANFNVTLPNSLADGFHFLSVRAKDVSNNWSVVAIRPFYKEIISTATIPNIVAMEYFIDTDPGYGAATAVSIAASTPLTQNFTVALPNTVADGFHFLSVRAKDSNNKWSVVAVRPFYKEVFSVGNVPNITMMEYFIDSDPGYGAATAVSVTAGSPLTQNFTVALPNTVSDGFHFLSFRAKDANNKWSVVAVRPFYKEVVSATTIPNITMMEYFIDADPGFGLGTAVNITTGSPVSQSISVALNSLPNGTHKLSIRAKDQNNKWSIVGIKDFLVRDNIAVAGTAIPIAWCKNTVFNIPFTVTGIYNAGNLFTAQLSNASGSFSSPTVLGTLSGTSGGTIVATIPNSVAIGTGYKIRIVSSNPVINDNPEIPFTVLAVCPPPCANALTFISTADDITNGTILKEANATTGLITASNKVTGTANATFRAKAIILGVGFKADNGVVFKAEVGGCN